MAGFCPNCGTPATDDAVFCRGCGAKLAEAIAAALGNRGTMPTTNATAPPPATIPSATGSSGSAAPSKSAGCGQEIVVIGLVFALLAVAGVGIAIYLAH